MSIIKTSPLKTKISILGCGWLGLPLAKHLLKFGNQIKGSTRSSERIPRLEFVGIQAYKIDILELNDNIESFLNADILVIAITSKSLDRFKSLIELVEKSSIKRVLYISSTSVYDTNNGTISEKNITNNSILSQIESLFLRNTHFDTTIVRFGGLFGYERKPGNFIKPPKLIKNPEGYINLIHQDDCIAILSEIISKEYWGEIFNACSSSHPKRKDFYQKEVFKLHGVLPGIESNSKNNYKIISNMKLVEKLNYRFKYDDLMQL